MDFYEFKLKCEENGIETFFDECNYGLLTIRNYNDRCFNQGKCFFKIEEAVDFLEQSEW